MIIGLYGKIAAGKDTVADYLVSKHNFFKITMSDIIKKELEKVGLEPTRDNMRRISLKYKKKYGNGVWAEKCIKLIKERGVENAVISGIRDSREVEVFRKEKDFFLVEVKADVGLRYERLLKRADRKDKVSSFAEFLEEDKKEEALFDVFSKCKPDYVLTNNSSFSDLYREVDEMLQYFRSSSS